MQFIWAFVIITILFIPFLVGGGFGLNALLQLAPHCSFHSQCSDEEVCINNRCIDACDNNNTCHDDSKCLASNHSTICQCYEVGYLHDHHMICRKSCSFNNTCSGFEICRNYKCYDNCYNNTCSKDQVCVSYANHSYSCRCEQSGYVFNKESGKCESRKTGPMYPTPKQ